MFCAYFVIKIEKEKCIAITTEIENIYTFIVERKCRILHFIINLKWYILFMKALNISWIQIMNADFSGCDIVF